MQHSRTDLSIIFQNTDWDMKFGDSDNINIINEVINLEFSSAMNTYIPKKIMRVRPRFTISPRFIPWSNTHNLFWNISIHS
jgi:hypothetical protein